MKWLTMLVLVAGCSVYDIPGISKVIGPKFKVGDCAINQYDLNKVLEFSEPDLSNIEKIIKIGKRNYLYKWNYLGTIESEFEITSYDLIMEKIACPPELQ